MFEFLKSIFNRKRSKANDISTLVKKYRFSPVEIEIIQAEQFTESYIPEGVCCRYLSSGYYNETHTVIYFTEPLKGGRKNIEWGDWIILEADGMHHNSMKDILFRSLYEKASVPESENKNLFKLKTK